MEMEILKSIGTTGKPHPQAFELAQPLMEEFINRGYIPADFNEKKDEDKN